jgi:hypothetical protein
MDAISQSILITVVAFSMIGFILFLGWNSARTKAEEKRILEEERRTRIISKRNEWGDAICKAVYQRKVAIDMTEDMVLEACIQQALIKKRLRRKVLIKRGGCMVYHAKELITFISKTVK